MKTVAVIILLSYLTSCARTESRMGDFEFAMKIVNEWPDAISTSCDTINMERLYLFQRNNDAYLISARRYYYISYVTVADNAVTVIDSNGGIGRYREIENTVLTMRQLPMHRIDRSQYRSYLKSDPTLECGF